MLEHVSDPTAHLRKANTLLKPGGIIAISFPDSGSRLAKLAGEKWWFLSPVHLYYFDRKTLGRMLEKAGFSVKLAK